MATSDGDELVPFQDVRVVRSTVAALLCRIGDRSMWLPRGHISGMLWVSVAAAVGATLGGLFLSLGLDWPSGATVVLVLGLAFFASQALRL